MGLEIYSIFNLPPHWRDENESNDSLLQRN